MGMENASKLAAIFGAAIVLTSVGGLVCIWAFGVYPIAAQLAFAAIGIGLGAAVVKRAVEPPHV